MFFCSLGSPFDWAKRFQKLGAQGYAARLCLDLQLKVSSTAGKLAVFCCSNEHEASLGVHVPSRSWILSKGVVQGAVFLKVTWTKGDRARDSRGVFETCDVQFLCHTLAAVGFEGC